MGTIEQGVRQAVENCLKVKVGERVIIITDEETIEIGSALKAAIENITPKIQFFIMEDFGQRPIDYPQAIDDAIRDADVIMMLRIQLERGSGTLFPGLREYSIRYGLNMERMKKVKPNVLVMHPGPINRGVEISPEVADGRFSVILDQVESGVAVRMALLYLLCGGGVSIDESAN